jgi:SPP1 family predicted phage head-tail adaptor
MSPAPTIGELRRRVTLEGFVDAPDASGGFTRRFTPLLSLWAKVEALDVQSQFNEQRLEELRTHAVTIRWRNDVTSGMRFDLAGRKLVITGVVDPDGAARFLRCLCQEIL